MIHKIFIKKEAVATDYADLREVQEVDMDYFITQKGIFKREKFSNQGISLIGLMAFMYGFE